MIRSRIHQINASGGGVPKLPVSRGVIDSSGLVGDQQNDTRHHGGPDRALCLFSLEVIEGFQSEGHPIAAGYAGENLTISGIEWAKVIPGSRYRIGETVEIEITGYTSPCYKNAGWFIDGAFGRMLQSRHPGESRVYARVLQGGEIAEGDPVVVVPATGLRAWAGCGDLGAAWPRSVAAAWPPARGLDPVTKPQLGVGLIDTYPADMDEYSVEPLRPDTWEAFAQLVERHNGVWGGCWCLAFHPTSPEGGQSIEGNRDLKQRLVNEGNAHAAVVFDGDRAVGWCQYGSPEELPRIYHRKEYDAGVIEPPDYRLTCFFVDRDYRREGVSAIALQGALDLIAEAGGGLVEGYPQDTQGKKANASFLYNGTRSLFEQAGFEYERPKGKNHCVMRMRIAPSRSR